MIRNTTSVTLVLLTILALFTAAAPSAVMAEQQWNRINLPSKVAIGTVPVIGMSPTFPIDHTIFMEDGVTLYESQDGGNTWKDTQSVHQYSSGMYGGGSTTKTPTARIYIPPDFDHSQQLVWCTNYAENYVEDLPISQSGNIVVSIVNSYSEPALAPGRYNNDSLTLESFSLNYLFGFAFGPDGTMYIAGGAELYNDGKMTADCYNYLSGGNSLCDVGSYISGIKVSPNFSNDKTMLIQTDDGVLISTDGGHGFTATALPVVDGYYDLEFSPNYASDGTIAVVVPGAGLFLSTDRGTKWRDVLPGESVTAAAIGPSGAIYAGTDYTYGTQDGVYASFDNGQDWQNIGLEGSEISTLYVFNGTSGDLLSAATGSELDWTTVTRPVSSTPEPVSPGGPISSSFIIGKDSYAVSGSVNQMDAAPFIENGRAYLPLRYLARALGIGVAWDDATQTVTLANSEKVLSVEIGGEQITINGEKASFDYPPVIKNGRTYLPASFLATYLNYDLTWDGQNQTIVISKPLS